MKKLKFSSIFSSIVALIMVLSLLSPMTASANSEQLNAFKQNSLDESTLALKAAVLEQLELSEDSPKLHSDLQNLSGSEKVAVIIHLSENPVALEMGLNQLNGKTLNSSQEAKIKQTVQQQQASVTKEMTLNGISFEKGFSYDTVLNGFSAKVKAEDVAKLLNIKGVTLVEPDTIVYASSIEDKKSSSPFIDKGEVEATMSTSIDFLGIEKLWDEGYEGQGISVAVLDTGIDANHPEFEGIYKGGKNFVPHLDGEYARERADDDASETSPEDWPKDDPRYPEFDRSGRSFYTNHGTHVAGTIAAIGTNDYGIKGIAPKVDLYAYRVLGAYGSGTYSGIIAAIDYAVKQDIDIINLSLGGGSNTETDAGSFAINNAMMAGTISVIATGNSGPNRGTMGTPSTARLGIAVGNSTNPEKMYDAQVNITVGDYKLNKQIDLMATTFGKDLATQLDGEYELVAVPGLGEAKDYEDIDVEGKVALISRGTIAFVDKIAHAKANGAVATIIHNFAGGSNAPDPSGTFLSDSFDFLPTFDMSQTDGVAIREALKTSAGIVTFGNFNSVTTLGDEIYVSSSRGPSMPNFDIKPDVVAPGTNIMSTIPRYGGDIDDADYSDAYDRKTGTSMATPHITGIAALILQANPGWSPFDVKVALSNTAKELNKEKFDVFAQGPGRVDAYAAAHPYMLAYAVDEAVLDATEEIVENLKGTVTFGKVDLEKDVTISKQIIVKDMSGNGGTFNISVLPTKQFDDATLTVDKEIFTIDPKGSELITVTLTVSAQEETKSGDEFLGYIQITTGEKDKTVKTLSVNETELSLINGSSKQLIVTETTDVFDDNYHSISLPFAADFSEVVPTEIINMAITETDLSFNGDGVKDTARLTFTLTGNVKTNYIELWDIMNPEGGEYGDGYIGYLHAGSALGAGSYTLNIAGQYQPWGSAPATTIPDGLYTIDFTAITDTGIIGDFVGPIFVKTTQPVVNGSVSDGILAGQVTDKYIEYIEELLLYDLELDLNEKLAAYYVITHGEDIGDLIPITLNQDGSFEVKVDPLNENEAFALIVVDAAGNFSEVFFVDNDSVLTSQPVNETPGQTADEGTSEEEGISEEEVSSEEESTSEEEGTIEEEGTSEEGGTTIEEVATPFVETTPAEQLIQEKIITEVSTDTKTNSVSTVTESKLIQVSGYNTVQSNFVEKGFNEGGYDRPNLRSENNDVTDEADYTSADPNIATVSETGLITAKNVGETTITVTYGEESVEVKVKVTPVPSSGGDSPAPTPPTGEVKVNPTDISVQIKDSTKSEVKVELPALLDAQPKASATIQSSSLKELSESSKPLVLASGTTEVTVPNSVLKAIAANSPENITISVGKSKSTDINGAVSEVYEFTITTVKNGKTETVSIFSEPVEITVSVSDSIKDPRKVAAYYVNETTNTLDYVGGKYSNGKLTFTTNHFSKFVVIESNLSFGDITSHWAKDPIEVLASRKITSGKSTGTFNPDDSLTREEYAVLLVRALNIPVTSYEGIFRDVTEKNSWSILQIEAAKRAGILFGDLEGNFNPTNKITREDMAAMIVRALEYKNASILVETSTTSKSFADDNKISTYAKDAIQKATALNIIKGIGNNKFAPKKDTTRAEAAVMLYQVLKLLEEI